MMRRLNRGGNFRGRNEHSHKAPLFIVKFGNHVIRPNLLICRCLAQNTRIPTNFELIT
jgi:hypothetical protein